MLLPLLMNLDMFSEPPPVTDFQGDATQAMATRWTAEQSLGPRWLALQSLTIKWTSKQENDV